MAYTQAFTAYKQTGVKTATQGKLIIMLYEEAVRQLNTALSLFKTEDSIEAYNIEKLHKATVKTQEIITELMVSLNMNAGGQLAHNLLALYMFFNQELLDGTIHHQKNKIHFVRDKMLELKDAWVQADSTTQTRASDMNPAISING
ncbi:MAG TPA: flagellar export chaperone FliS [Treponemataceae bacterium]|nr:flagellar export chaperone FliS [Treponema sp.]HUH44063.1 flagellar export chaperone FliS [Treponemataceae bacterium]